MRLPILPTAAAAIALACFGTGPARAAEPTDAAGILQGTAGTVTLDVQNVPLDDVLRILSKQFGLSIITARNVDTQVTARFKDVSLDEALNSLVTINGFAYRLRGGVIEVYSPTTGEGAVVGQARIETFALKYANAEKTKELLKSFLSKDSGKIEAETARNTLIVYDLPGSLEAVATVIERVDRPEPQVTICAEIIEVSTDITDKLGIDWATRVAVTGSSRPISFPLSKNQSGSFFPTGDVASGEFIDGESFPLTAKDDFTFGTLDATGLQVALNILRSDGDADLIANPEITTLNNHEAKINIGDVTPVALFTTNLETGVSAVTGFEDIETGIILTVTPQVNEEDGLITLHVTPEISEVLGFVGQFDERPIIGSRKAETNVRVHDGETLVIGGLVREKKDETITKFPLLGDIPLLGWFFTNKDLTKTKTTLYIFVTPRIVRDNNYKNIAKKAATRLHNEGLDKGPRTADDLRNDGASPFE